MKRAAPEKVQDEMSARKTVVKEVYSASANTVNLSIPFSEAGSDDTVFRVVAIGIYAPQAGLNAEDVKITQANTAAAAKPGSFGCSTYSDKWCYFGETGIPLLKSNGDITVTLTRGATNAMGLWVSGYFDLA